MLSSKWMSTAASVLLMFAGAACAEVRTFEFSGTVTQSADQAFANVGTPVRGTFSYELTTAPSSQIEGYMASYRPSSFMTATIAGHTVISDRLGIDVINDTAPGVPDQIDVFGWPIAIDQAFSLDGSLGIRVMTSGTGEVLNGTALPTGYNVGAFNPATSYGWVQRDGSQTGTVVIFSIDAIWEAECTKQNGKPAKKHCTVP